MKFKDLIGHRIIYRQREKDLIELIVLEISPSGKRVKLKYPSGSEDWSEIKPYDWDESLEKNIIEDLGKVKKTKGQVRGNETMEQGLRTDILRPASVSKKRNILRKQETKRKNNKNA